MFHHCLVCMYRPSSARSYAWLKLAGIVLCCAPIYKLLYIHLTNKLLPIFVAGSQFKYLLLVAHDREQDERWRPFSDRRILWFSMGKSSRHLSKHDSSGLFETSFGTEAKKFFSVQKWPALVGPSSARPCLRRLHCTHSRYCFTIVIDLQCQQFVCSVSPRTWQTFSHD